MTLTSEHSSPIVVLCPMAIERRAIIRALVRRRLASAETIQTGIGKDAIVGAVKHLAARVSPLAGRPRFIILAGACGGLAPVADVPPIHRIIDEHGHSWQPGFSSPGARMPPPGVTLIGVDTIVATPTEKRALAARTGASIVDMESHAFAAVCEQFGLAWNVVRGVSDTPDETLPAEVLRWIDAAGNTRSLRAARDLMMKPRLIPHIAGVLRRSARVLPQVGEAVADLVAACTHHPSDAVIAAAIPTRQPMESR